MSRGGKRKGAGRKSGWNHSPTQTVRVPKIFAAQVLAYAKELDALEPIEPLLSESTLESARSPVAEASPGQMDLLSLASFNLPSIGLGAIRPMTEGELNQRLQFSYSNQVSRMRGRFKHDEDGFIKWSKGRERRIGLEVVGWSFNNQTGLFHPVDNPCDDFQQVK